MSSRVIQANFGGGQPRASALLATSPTTSQRWPAPPPRPFVGGPPSQLGATGGHAVLPKRPGAEPAHAPGRSGFFPVDPVQLGLARGGGKPLPAAILAKMEAAFHQDFSAVRVHEGPQAARIGALAFTFGTDIYFAPGRYDPHSTRGQQLIGHELAHVVQQRQGRVSSPTSGFAVVQDAALELEADRLGQRAAMSATPATAAVAPSWPGKPQSALMKRDHGRVAQPMKAFFSKLFGPKQQVPHVITTMERIQALEGMTDKIVVAYGAVDQNNQDDVLQQMQSFMAGTLVVWRGVQQCHPAFPANPYTNIASKNPGSTAPPDFGDNDNNWIPFYENKNACLSVALSWSHSIAGYFTGRGGMDSARPCALLLEKRLNPHVDKVAFGMAPEVQVWGPTVAVPTLYGIDDDWKTIWPAGPYQAGDTFRKFATASNVLIT